MRGALFHGLRGQGLQVSDHHFSDQGCLPNSGFPEDGQVLSTISAVGPPADLILPKSRDEKVVVK